MTIETSDLSYVNRDYDIVLKTVFLDDPLGYELSDTIEVKITNPCVDTVLNPSLSPLTQKLHSIIGITEEATFTYGDFTDSASLEHDAAGDDQGTIKCGDRHHELFDSDNDLVASET